MATFMNAFPMGDQPYSGAFVPACFTSCMSISSRFFKMVIFSSTASNLSLTPSALATISPALGTTFNTALHAWLWDRQTPHVVELCSAGTAAPDTSLPWCGTCRNKSDPLYDEYLTYRKDHRPPAPHAPPPLSRLALHTSGTEHLGRFTALCLFSAIVIGLGASHAKHVGAAARNAPGARGFASDTDMEVAGERQRLLRAGDVDFDDESGEGGRPMRSFGALMDAGRGGGPGGFTLADDTGPREYPKGARGALARLAADLSTAPGGAKGAARASGWATASDKGGRGAGPGGGAQRQQQQQQQQQEQQLDEGAPGVVGAKAAALMRNGGGARP
jgi:hypothetical protein